MIYLDNSATTNLSEEARTAMLQAYDEVWGNPSSVHSMGINSKKLLESSRNTIMKALNLTPSDGKIIFCGSGTEANNLALYGIAHAKKKSSPPDYNRRQPASFGFANAESFVGVGI